MSKINYNLLAVEGLKEILVQVSETCNELGIDFFIVGATARNIWLAAHDENVAGTKDIDFGIYVSNIEEYNNLKNKLSEKYNYTVSTGNAFSLISHDGIQIDLLPFGEIVKNGQVIMEGMGLTKINLEGFEEAFLEGSTKTVIGKESYTVCSIPAVVILKMIAFDDRPDQRIKDIKDINLILTFYPQLESEMIWSDHFDLYGVDRTHDEVAMMVLGRQIKKIISGNLKLMTRIIEILNKAINEESSFLTHMIEYADEETVQSKVKLLINLKKGIID